MRLIFERTESGRFKRLKKCWRKPRGIQNKLKVGKKGIKPKIGYKKSNKEQIPTIKNLNEVKKLNSKEILISSTVGKKKRIEIQEFCEKNKIKVLNFKKFKIVKKAEKGNKKSNNKESKK
jgi:large subunit ribosomal protein L32e